MECCRQWGALELRCSNLAEFYCVGSTVGYQPSFFAGEVRVSNPAFVASFSE